MSRYKQITAPFAWVTNWALLDREVDGADSNFQIAMSELENLLWKLLMANSWLPYLIGTSIGCTSLVPHAAELAFCVSPTKPKPQAQDRAHNLHWHLCLTHSRIRHRYFCYCLHLLCADCDSMSNKKCSGEFGTLSQPLEKQITAPFTWVTNWVPLSCLDRKVDADGVSLRP